MIIMQAYLHLHMNSVNMLTFYAEEYYNKIKGD